MKRKTFAGDGRAALVLILPAFIVQLAFSAFPLVSALWLSLTRWDLIPNSVPAFIGLDNYKNLLRDEYFYKCLLNTLLISVTAVPLSTGAALLVSTLLTRPVRAVNLYKLAYFLPSICTLTAVVTVWGYILGPGDGMLNNALRAIGIATPPGWLASEQWVIPAIAIIGIWLWLGYDTVIYLAGLKAIPRAYVEAAELDGANGWTKFWKITVPLVSPTTFFLLVTGFASSFQIFDLIYVFTGGGPAGRTMVVNMYIYQNAFRYMKMGYASAASFILFLIILAVTVFQLRMQKRWVHYAE